jgi:lipopolysaccharide/colanic/teichoic acid biosynthesis glycosyltransferase
MLKRTFDLFLSGFGILLSFPLWVLISILIYLEDKGNPFFTQDRVGKDGRLFRVYKFRSMKMNSDKLYPPMQAQENDPRVTQAGRVLRATALDELPQLLNIFIGDMSFVGPRALMPNEIEVHAVNENKSQMESLFERRGAVRPGLTGVAQIFLPRDVPRSKKFRYDVFYIRNQKFLLDLKLIFLSFWITFRGKWESREDKLRQVSEKYHV